MVRTLYTLSPNNVNEIGRVNRLSGNFSNSACIAGDLLPEQGIVEPRMSISDLVIDNPPCQHPRFARE